MELKEVFRPLQVGSLTLKNRIVLLPMGTGLAKGGAVTDELIAYYVARARGGVGLITVEFTVCHEGAKTAHNLSLLDDSQIPRWRELVTAVHAHGAAIFPQLAHQGPQISSAVTGSPVVAPSAVPCPMMKEVPKALTRDDIQELTKGFGDAAVRAKAAGCDGVQIHGAHGYLVNSFMSPFSNKRIDEYGGTLLNRMRFPLEIISEIKSRCGNDFPVSFRYCFDELVPGGICPEEGALMAKILEDAGIDLLDVSRGIYGSIKWIFPPHGTPVALNAWFGERLKKILKIPVLISHRINDPLVAEIVLLSGQADLIGMGRALIADPELPRKAKEGRFDDISPCIACNQGCLGRIMEGDPIACMINPSSGREKELPITPTDQPKKILVVGGGVAGMEAARVAAIRGHQVTLCEKSDRLGGQFCLAAVPSKKQDFAKAVAYFTTQLNKTGVTVKLNTAVTADTIAAASWDVVIVATGAAPLVPAGISGIENAIVSTGHDVLSGEVPMGDKVVVVGGGMVGCEVAGYLAERGVGQVTILEMLPDVAMDAIAVCNRQFLMEDLSAHHVSIVTGATVKEITPDGLAYTKEGKDVSLNGISNVVLAVGVTSFDPISKALDGKVPELYVIGDASQPRMAVDAIEAGTRLARRL